MTKVTKGLLGIIYQTQKYSGGKIILPDLICFRRFNLNELLYIQHLSVCISAQADSLITDWKRFSPKSLILTNFHINI